MQLVGNEWVMVVPNSNYELYKAALYKLNGSALGGYFGHKTIGIISLLQVLLDQVRC